MTEEQIKEKAEFIALGTFLSAWPNDLGYNDVMDLMTLHDAYDLADKGIDIWQPFENHSPEDVTGYIQDLHDHIVHSFTLEEH